MEQTHQRTCTLCQRPFEAIGFMGVCDSCAALRPAQKPLSKRELGDSWPVRHRDKVEAMQGPSLAKAMELCKLVVDGSAMLVLTGDRGRGKTQIATRLAWERGQRGLRCGMYAKAFDLFGDVKSTWGKNAVRSESKVMGDYKSAPFLCLDECHERGETDWENRTLRNVLDHRYDACLPTVIIGNWSTKDEISDCLGASIVDRITETGGTVWCNWDSYRAA